MSSFLPERFRLPIVAAAEDIDELGHVGNQVYLRWVLDVALAHSASVGWTFDRYRELGAVFVVRRHELDYIAQVTVGQALSLETWVDEWRQASCIRNTEILRDGKVVARAATTWAMIALDTGRPMRIPDELAAIFGRPG